ncbi:MAG: calcium-binding protein [Methylococcales bacterium]
MISTTTLFDKALLAEASYADFRIAEQIDGTYNKDKVIAALITGDFSAIQAKEFAQHWQVVSHRPDTVFGFSATLFKNIQTGEYVFANRGTAGLFGDIALADMFGIVLEGIATGQILDMYRYFRTLETAKGEPVAYSPAEIALLKSFTGPVNMDVIALESGLLTDIGEGAITNATSVSVAGHSLGGHLSTWFEAFFANRTNHVYTFNGAGIGGFGVEIVDLLTQAFGDGKMFSLSNSDITNIYAEPGVEMTAGVGAYVGDMLPVFIEDQGFIGGNLLIANHSISHLTDALAVYRIVNSVDASLNLNQIKTLLEVGSNEPKESLEAIVNALGDLFNVGTTVGIDRDELYGRLKAIEMSLYVDPYAATPILKPEYQNLHIVDVASLAGSATLNTGTGLAYRYALKGLTPFAITNLDYSAHDVGGELDLYDPSTGQGQITEQWLSDRAHLLTQIIHRNSVDSVMLVGGGSNETYQDMATGQLFSTTDVGNVFGPGFPPDSKHIIFGDDNANQDIVGGTKVDHLYGGGGDDIVIGNKGNDYLEGGLGSDIYIYAAGDGFDTIVDIDGLGIITIDGISLDLNDGKKTSPNSWLTQDKQYQLMIGPVNASGQQDLFISNTSLVSDKVSITVKNFTEGDFGINFPLSVQPSVLKPSNVILGDLTPFDFNIEKTGIQSKYDDLGNIITDPNINEPGRDDTIKGSAGNDQIEGRLGADILDGLEGNDVLVGGGGRDSIIAGIGNDILYGGDLINIEELADFIDVGGATEDGSYGDFLSAGMGDDTLIGSAQSDALMGGEGDDLMIGGAGHDVLFGDATYQTPGSDWTVGGANQAYPAADETSPIWGSGIGLDQVTGIFDTGTGGRDRIYGGSGGDWIIAGREDDVVYGESGMDSIDGGAGNDILLGGEDDDSVNGDLGVGDVTRHGDDYIDLGAGTTAQYARGDGGNDVILGGDTNDTIEGDDLRGPNVPANYHGADYIDGKGGDDTIWGEGADDIIYGGAGNDSLYGDMGTKYVAAAYQGDDILDGGAGNDSIFGDGGNDEIHGGIGNDLLFGDASDVEASAHGDDIIYGDDGDDQLQGGGGNDILNGGTGNDKLLGEDGDDWLSGSDGVDMLMGGAGNDTLEGGAGHDLYFYNLGDGIDTINDHAEIVGVSGVQVGNTLSFGIGIGQNDLSLGLGSLLINLPGGGGIHIEGFDPNNPLANPVIDTFQFADGSLLPYSQLISRGFDIVGTDLDDELNGTATNDRVFGLAGNDKIFASAGADVLYGGAVMTI